MNPPHPLTAVLFDLDGTLVDSARDLAAATNRTLRDLGLAPRPEPEVLLYVGDGAVCLLARAIAAARGRDAWTDPARAEGAVMLPRFQAHYLNHLNDHTVVLPGARELLEELASRAKLGIITNKPETPARRLLEALEIAHYFCVVLGGDSLATRKPEPEMIAVALEHCGATPAEALIVGDGLTDAEAGRRARVRTVGIPSCFGRNPERIADAVDLLLPDLAALATWLRA